MLYRSVEKESPKSCIAYIYCGFKHNKYMGYLAKHSLIYNVNHYAGDVEEYFVNHCFHFKIRPTHTVSFANCFNIITFFGIFIYR